MILRSPPNDEKRMIWQRTSGVVIPAGGNLGLFLPRHLDTRPRFREGMLCNRGYDGPLGLS